MKEKEVEHNFKAFERIAKGNRLVRWSNRPLNYPVSLIHSHLIYPMSHSTWKRNAKTFWGAEMNVPLPAGLDIFLTGGKSHDSEIRLAKWLRHALGEGDVCLDIGAHIGFFTLWMAHLVGQNGKVLSFEPSAKIFEILKENIQIQKQIQAFNIAFSNESGKLSFHEFDALHSEYNSLDPEWHREEKWMQKAPPKIYEVSAISLDDWFAETKLVPDVIKIDVEGGELSVLRGAEMFLQKESPAIVIEVQTDAEKRGVYYDAIRLMSECGYMTNEITADGSIKALLDLEAWMDNYPLESDNLVLLKD